MLHVGIILLTAEVLCHWINEFSENHFLKNSTGRTSKTNGWLYRLHCRIISRELLLVWAKHTVKRRRYVDANGDYKSVFGMGMVLSVERCIVFAICSLVNCYSGPTHAQAPFDDLLNRVWFESGTVYIQSFKYKSIQKVVFSLKAAASWISVFTSRYHQINWWIFQNAKTQQTF